MERRENQQTVSDLQGERVSAMQSVQDLIAQNEALQAQVDALEEENRVLNNQSATAELENDRLEKETDAQARSLQAMDWFWQINEAYVRGSWSTARKLAGPLPAAGLEDALPTESITDHGRFSPADRYAEICEDIF